MATALYGGTFDPPHLAHLALIQTALMTADIHQVFCLPSGSPYHKSQQLVSPAIYRYCMTKLLLEALPQVLVLSNEILRDKATYTYDSVQELRQTYGLDKPYWLMGTDLLFDLPSWYRAQDLLSSIRLLVATRESAVTEELEAICHCLQTEYGAELQKLEAPLLPYSSTAIREAYRQLDAVHYEKRQTLLLAYLRAHRPDRLTAVQEQLIDENKYTVPEANELIQSALPASIRDFIAQHDWYSREGLLFALDDEVRQQLHQIEKDLFRRLSPYRLCHSWNVLFTALELALRFGEDPNLTALAALCHDALKEAPLDELERWAPHCEESLKHPALWHGPAGAVWACGFLGRSEENFRASLHYHSTLRAGASRLEKIIFLADKIEPSRRYDDLTAIREASERDLDEACLLCLEAVEASRQRKSVDFHPLSQEALTSLRN